MKTKKLMQQTILLTANQIKEELEQHIHNAEECAQYAIAIRELARAFKEVR